MRIGTLGSAVRAVARRVRHRRAFRRDFLPRLPEGLRAAAEWVFFRSATPEEKRLAREIESFRQKIADQGADVVESFGSPHSGTFSLDERGMSAGGPVTKAEWAAHARTGANPRHGLLLRRLTVGLEAGRILELGTNTGMSGCYFLSAPSCRELITVEGSESLCAVAERNLTRISDRFRLENRLFDEAIADLEAEGVRDLDLVYLDGQHEREATLHYVDRVRPLLAEGGAILLDDIYWSEGMNEAWKEVRSRPGVHLSLDLGLKGVLLFGEGDGAPLHLDICEYTGRPEIFRKGW